MQHIAPVISYGSWGWQWNASVSSRINGFVANTVRIMLGMRRCDGDDRVQGHVRTMSAANKLVQHNFGGNPSPPACSPKPPEGGSLAG